MPNIKSAKKRVLVSEVRNARNRAIKTAVKTQVKKFDAAIEAGTNVEAAYKAVVATVDKAAAKGVMHKNTAARRKSALARKMNAAK
ncbi:MAG: 30S ribosomal protein S20 [Clostridia bacterium]|nr:30S ribosomal protein S20 [Clostridia bacterium]MBR5266201.1 30S ribosomal protein S20 [Clostridia bacterium]